MGAVNASSAINKVDAEKVTLLIYGAVRAITNAPSACIAKNLPKLTWIKKDRSMVRSNASVKLNSNIDANVAMIKIIVAKNHTQAIIEIFLQIP